jgi:TolB-like protein
MGDKKLEGFEETHELFSLNIPDKFIPLDADFTSSENKPITENKFRWGSLVGWVSGILLIIFIVFSSIPYFGKSDVNTTIKIAVFPFENIIKNKDFDWLSDGIARTLTFQLSKINTLKVIDQLQILKTIETVQPKEASMAYDIVARKTAEKMNINLLLSGSYQIYGEKLQITAQLIEVESGIVEPLMMGTYSLDSLLFMQHDVANKITILLNNKSGN